MLPRHFCCMFYIDPIQQRKLNSENKCCFDVKQNNNIRHLKNKKYSRTSKIKKDVNKGLKKFRHGLYTRDEKFRTETQE